MYSTCYHCLAPLGHNAAIAPFPVGRRLAFDAARARIWAVCLHCGRWNLAPIEERCEAIEDAERLFRAARRRYGTANVGLAELADGTELVRIGPALRPELAAWRYGGRLLQTRRRAGGALFRATTAAAAGAARVRRWLPGARGRATPEEIGLQLALAGPSRGADRVLDVVRAGASPTSAAPAGAAGDVPVVAIRRRHLAGAVIVRPDGAAPWELEIPHEGGAVRLLGAHGLRTAARLLAVVNAYGATPATVAAATRKVEEAADPDGYFNRVLRVAWRSRWGRAAAGAAAEAPAEAAAHHWPATGGADAATGLAVALTGRVFWGHGGVGSPERQPLLGTPLVDRLALEIAAHEDAERASLSETLAALEVAWREAEEIARIVDAL